MQIVTESVLRFVCKDKVCTQISSSSSTYHQISLWMMNYPVLVRLLHTLIYTFELLIVNNVASCHFDFQDRSILLQLLYRCYARESVLKWTHVPFDVMGRKGSVLQLAYCLR